MLDQAAPEPAQRRALQLGQQRMVDLGATQVQRKAPRHLGLHLQQQLRGDEGIGQRTVGAA